MPPSGTRTATRTQSGTFIRKRSCTNQCFLVFFILFLVGWGLLTYYAFKYGDPEQVFLPTDSDGSICGRGVMQKKPYLLYFNILKCAKLKSLTSGCDTQMVCVERCPDFTRSYSEYTKKHKFDALPEKLKNEVKKNLTCKFEIDKNKISIEEIPYLLSKEKCAQLYFKSIPHFGRCFPSVIKKEKMFLDDTEQRKILEFNGTVITPKEMRDTTKAFAITFNARALGELILSDILESKYFILNGLLIGAALSFFWILLMQAMAGLMVWISMITLIILSGYFSVISYKNYDQYSSLNETQLDKLENDELNIMTEFDLIDIIKIQFNSILLDHRFWLFLLIVSLIFFLLLAITFIALRQRVRIAISLIKVASKAIMAAKLTLFLPLIPYVFHLALFFFFVLNALLIVATHKPAYRYSDGPLKWEYCDSRSSLRNLTCSRYQLLDQNYVKYVHGYNLFGFFWIWFFIHGIFQLIFAGVFARYYWTYNKKKNLPKFLILNSTCVAIRYHIGTIALGSFLTATVKTLQVIIEYIDRKCKQYADSPISRVIFWCMRGCFWLLDNFLRYINTNAYIMVAVYGKGYFDSAKNAFNLILNNIIRAVVIDKVADYLLFFGKLAITAFMGFGTYYAIEFYDYFSIDHKPFPKLNYTHAVPVMAVSIGTYLFASTFFSVYEMAVNTIFLCFLKDCEENDGSTEKPYYMPQNLLKIMRKVQKTKTHESEETSESLSRTVSDEKPTTRHPQSEV